MKIEYMLTNSEATLDADEIEMLRDLFIRCHGQDAFMVDINDDTKEIIESILKQKLFTDSVYDDDNDTSSSIHTKRLF